MIKVSQPIPIDVQVDPLTIASGYKILNGNIIQTYNRETAEFSDDRTLIPLILMPDINILDPHGKMSGVAVLTGVEWYEGVPSASTLISNSADYEISAAGAPQYSLKCKKNVDVNTPLEVYYKAYFTHVELNKAVSVEGVIPLRTSYFDATNYNVKLNQPQSFTVDPTRATLNAKGFIEVSLSAQLYSGTDEVADANAAYFFFVLENSNWRLITADDVFVLSGLSGGRFSKNLVINASLFELASFKVAAVYYDSTYPAAAADNAVQDVTTINVSLPASAEGKIRVTKGQYIAPDVDQSIECEAWIEDNTGIILNPDKYYMCFWYCKLNTVGATEKQIGHGFSLSTTSQAIGVTNIQGAMIYAKIYETSCYKLKVNEAGKVLVNNLGEALVIKTIKN